jgi:DNA-binding MarR family transcriptional regulator
MSNKPISDKQFAVLAALRANPRASIRELCEATGITSTSVVTYQLDRLEEAGLLRRDRFTARGIYVGEQPTQTARQVADRRKCHNPETNRKKAQAARKGRGADVHSLKPNPTLEARIEAIVARAQARVVNNDVLQGEQVLHSDQLRAVRVG